jgi:dCTP deaminase
MLEHEALIGALRSPNLDERLVVTPLLEESQVGEASIDLRLGTDFLILQRTVESGINPKLQSEATIEQLHAGVTVPLGRSIWLHPQHFILAATFEFIRLPATMGAYVVGRSSWGRVGLVVATAIMVHPGFTGCLTLELVNQGDSPIALFPGSRIAQLAIHHLSAKTSHVYGAKAKYRAPIGPEPSRLSKERDEIDRLALLAKALQERLR